MITIAMILLIVGLAFTVGPYLLKLLLGGFSAIAPATVGTTIYLSVLICAFIVLNILLNMTFKVSEEGGKRRQAAVHRRKLRKVTGVVMLISGVSLILMLLNSVIVRAYNGWNLTLSKNPDVFAGFRYVGIVFIVGAVGFFIGKRYRDRLDDDEEDCEDDSDGNATGTRDETPMYNVQNFGSVRRIVGSQESSRVVRDDQLNVHLPNNARSRLYSPAGKM